MDDLSQTCERIASAAGRQEKISILADYLTQLDDSDLIRAIHFLTGNPVADAPREQTLFGWQDPPKLTVGHATIRRALQLATGWDMETLRHCFRAVGDSGETVSHILKPVAQAQPLSLARAEQLLFQLVEERQASKRESTLAQVFQTYKPSALKYLVKSFSGNFRIGLQEKMVEEAIALSTRTPIAEFRAAKNLSGDLSQTALAARHRRLSEITVQLFHPMDFMLAKALPDPLPEDVLGELVGGSWLVEEKYDGIRAQVHVENGVVEIYSRSLECVTSAFPELADAFRSMTTSAILDGEILAWKDGRALPFSVLQQRLARKIVNRNLIVSNPVVFMSYDILYHADELLLDSSATMRRQALIRQVQGCHPLIRLAPQNPLTDSASIDKLFDQARANGNEGLILKQAESPYEPAKRSGSWLKIKKVYATLDVVVTAVEQGHGKRAHMLSDFTFAVINQNQYVNIGKAYSGLTDVEIRELTRLFKASTVGRYGNRVLQVLPSVVLEVGFDGIQRSSRHKSGFALRFPRILRWRTDKSPAQCDTLDRVRELYDSSLNLTANTLTVSK